MTAAAGIRSAGSAQPTTGTRDPILTSKVVVPAVPGWLIPRPRLDKLIAEGASGPITAVTGPPGSGKTMALALWAAANHGGNPAAWVTVDDYDNQPGVFWPYVLYALGQAGVCIPKSLAASARRSPIDHRFLLQFASMMAARDPGVALVLDDAHLLHSSEVLTGLAYVLKHAKPGLHLVVSSRLYPALPLHRYRLAGELCEIRASDLAFTVTESRLLLEQHGVTISDECLRGLTKRAEGWAAVMRMATISIAGHYHPEEFASELVAEDAAVTEYLVDEVLNAEPAQVRDFLLRTSILDRVSEGIASELSGNGRGAATLVGLARANPLIERDDSGWYRYHSLFAAVLRLKLRREDPGQVADLHRRAAGWYRRNGALADAVKQLEAIGEEQLSRHPEVRAQVRALRHDLELAHRHRRELEPGVTCRGWPQVPQARPPTADQGDVLIVEPLSEREREVLQFVSAMESNAEIAAKMYISVNTVKTHLKSVYRKLAATHRGEAVRRARELGIL